MAGVLVALALVCAACTTSPGAHTSGRTTTTTTPSGRSTSTSTTTPAPLPAGASGTAAQVPWHQVGPGWILATWQASAPQSPAAPTTVLLVDPTGGRYALGRAPAATRLVGWSGDGHHALFVSDTSTVQVVVMDVQSGAQQALTLPEATNGGTVRFTRPDGVALYETGLPVQRFGLTGSLQFAYPTSLGTPAGTAPTGWAVESPDGTQLAFSALGGVDIVTNDGHLVRYLAYPSGPTSCELQSWWKDDGLLLACGGELWTQPANGATARALTTTAAAYLGAWDLPTGVVAEAGACGTTWLVSVAANGSTTRLAVPGASTGSVRPAGVDGDRMAVIVTANCDDYGPTAPTPTDSLEWYEPSTGAATPLISSSSIGGWIDDAVAFGYATPAA